MRAHCLPRLDSLHSRLASSLVIPFAHHHVRVPQLWNTKLPCHMVIYNNSAVTIEQLCMHICHCVMSVVSKAKAFYCWICFAFGNIFFSRSWPTVSSFDKVWRSAVLLKNCCYFHWLLWWAKNSSWELLALEGRALHNAQCTSRWQSCYNQISVLFDLGETLIQLIMLVDPKQQTCALLGPIMALACCHAAFFYALSFPHTTTTTSTLSSLAPCRPDNPPATPQAPLWSTRPKSLPFTSECLISFCKVKFSKFGADIGILKTFLR